MQKRSNRVREYDGYTIQEYGGTLLHKYAFYADLNEIKHFLSLRSCEINTTNKYGETALHLIARNLRMTTDKEEIAKNKECYYYLLSKGGSIDINDAEGISPRIVFDEMDSF